MNQQPLPPDSDPKTPTSKPGIQQQANNSAMGGGMQAVQGKNNIQNHGNNNFILIFNQDINPSAIAISLKELKENNPDPELQFVRVNKLSEKEVSITIETNSNAEKSELEKNEYVRILEHTILEQQKRLVGEKIFEEYKYDGKLVTILLQIYEEVSSKKICPILTIAFGNPEVQIPNLDEVGKSIDIKFGMKAGELCFSLSNGAMPLNQRQLVVSQDNSWKGTFIGKPDAPIWEFGFQNKVTDENQSEVLSGSIADQRLGTIELLKADTSCELQAIFKISVNRNYIVIINLDDATNTSSKILKETKIALLLNYLKTELKLENYVYKVVMKYEPATIS